MKNRSYLTLSVFADIKILVILCEKFFEIKLMQSSIHNVIRSELSLDVCIQMKKKSN
mgnify:CR=1 FL=1